MTLRPAVATASSKGDLLDGSRQMPGSLSHGRRENLSRSTSSEMREEPGLVRPNTEVGCNATCCNQTWGPSKVSRKTTRINLCYWWRLFLQQHGEALSTCTVGAALRIRNIMDLHNFYLFWTRYSRFLQNTNNLRTDKTVSWSRSRDPEEL